MTTFADVPARPATRAKRTTLAGFERRFGGMPFRQLMSSAAAHLGVAHPCRFELERRSLFETASPERG